LHLNHFRFYETPFPHSQNTIQNKSEKNYSCYDDAYMYLTAKNNLFFLEPYLQLLERDFTNQVPPVYRLFPQSRRT
jgi:hypothetical protein